MLVKLNAWEQRKVSDLLQERNEQTPMSEEYPLMAFVANQGVAPKGERYDRSALVNDEAGKKYKRTEYGDFIYSSNNLETGSIGLNKYGNACISPVYSIFKPIGKADLDFLGRRFLRKDFINEMVKWRQGVVYGQWKIHESDFLNIEIAVPSVDEQKAIGQYFDNLDNLITLHQRKCDLLKKTKKYMLQKMFPKKGDVKPEIRFVEFTDAWEQRKLEDVLKRRVEQRQQSEEYPRLAFASGQGVIPLSERKTNNREQLTKDEFTKKYLVTELDDIVYNPANVKYGAIDRNKCGRGLISPIYVTFTTSEIPGFIERIVTSHDFQQRALKFEEGTVTKRQSVNPEDFVTIDILVAPQKEEQRKISEYFDSLDHLITLHQRKLKELKEYKKWCLKNMFV